MREPSPMSVVDLPRFVKKHEQVLVDPFPFYVVVACVASFTLGMTIAEAAWWLTR